MSELQRNEAGNLPGIAWPGGYSILYLCADGEVMCARCSSDEEEASETAEDPSWRLVSAFVHWEGAPIYCSNCNNELPSEYGDPEVCDE